MEPPGRKSSQVDVETDPSGRYTRFDERLGGGSFKVVWRAFDNEEGREVAWNTVRINVGEMERITREIHLLQSLSHPNILKFYAHWENHHKNELVFITELMTSGTLIEFVRKHRPQTKIIQKWAIQILKGLEYLHNHAPNPIIHRDLKCDNIFISSNVGQVKIGDLGLATKMHTSRVFSVLGTPEYMAPELYDEGYTQKVDIYAFGMCILEIVTAEHPYKECSNPAQIYKRVTQGIPPQSLSRITDSLIKNLVEMCISSEDRRPTASQLLRHPFITTEIGAASDIPANDVASEPAEAVAATSLLPSENSCSEVHNVVVSSVEVVGRSGSRLSIMLVVEVLGGRKAVQFPFDIVEDVVEDVVNEMIADMHWNSSCAVEICRCLTDIITQQSLVSTSSKTSTDTTANNPSTIDQPVVIVETQGGLGSVTDMVCAITMEDIQLAQARSEGVCSVGWSELAFTPNDVSPIQSDSEDTGTPLTGRLTALQLPEPVPALNMATNEWATQSVLVPSTQGPVCVDEGTTGAPPQQQRPNLSLLQASSGDLDHDEIDDEYDRMLVRHAEERRLLYEKYQQEQRVMELRHVDELKVIKLRRFQNRCLVQPAPTANLVVPPDSTTPDTTASDLSPTSEDEISRAGTGESNSTSTTAQQNGLETVVDVATTQPPSTSNARHARNSTQNRHGHPPHLGTRASDPRIGPQPTISPRRMSQPVSVIAAAAEAAAAAVGGGALATEIANRRVVTMSDMERQIWDKL